MRTAPLAAALVMLSLLAGAPTASAAGSSLALTGPKDAVRAEGPATATVDIALTLQGVSCVGNGDIPVRLQIGETKGLRSAELTWTSVLFRIAATTASAQPWTGHSEVGVRLWGQDPTGSVTVLGSYQLPPNCVSADGKTSGQASTMIHVLGPELAPEPVPPPEVPPLTQRTNELAYAQESSEVAKPMFTLPLPVICAILGMCAGGLVVFYKRLRPLASG